MGNEFSSAPDGVVEAVLQFNDVRSVASTSGPFTAFVTVDNEREQTLKKNADPLKLRLTARSVVSMRVIAAGGNVLGTCYIPVSEIQSRGLGMVLYHTWLLLENVPCRGLEDINKRFEQSLYHIGKSLYQPKVCITLASVEEYTHLQNGGIYPLVGVPNSDSNKAARYYSLLYSHFQHLQLCQSYYISLQQKEQQLRSSPPQNANGSRGPSFGGQDGPAARDSDPNRRSLIFGDTSEIANASTRPSADFSPFSESPTAAAASHAEKVRRLTERCETLEQEVAMSRKQMEDMQARSQLNVAKVLETSQQTQDRMQGEIDRLKTEMSKGSRITNDSQSTAETARLQEQTGRLQEEIRSITEDANKRIDKANDTIRLLRNQNKDLQSELQKKILQLEERSSKGGGLDGGFASLDMKNLLDEKQKQEGILRAELEAERTKKTELVGIVQELYSSMNLHPVGGEEQTTNRMVPSPRGLQQHLDVMKT